jgi:protein SCO1/2
MFMPAFLLSLVPAAPAEDAAHLAVIRRAPVFALTTQDGKTLRLADLRGKVLLVSFIFTTCNGSCPATTARMSTVAQALKRKGLFKGDGVRLLSITLDPKRDSPAALRRYMRLYDLDARHWTFLTGPAEKVNKVITAWGMWVKEAPRGQLDHPSRIFLVDKRGRIRELYNLDYFKPKWVLADVQALQKERAREKPAPRK